MPTSPFNQSDVQAALGGRFDLDCEIGIGGQGVVYKAERHRTPNGQLTRDDVALKVHSDPGQDQRIERELRVMEGMRHPNLANLLEHGVLTVAGDTYRYAAWEFIRGEAFDRRIAQGPIPPKVVCAIGRDVARAIDHLWTNERIVHRDVNPKNIMVRVGDREAVLIDLGIAKHLSQAPITAPTITWGTVGYFSPEQARAEQNLTAASDVFSLAITLQEALLGRHPTARNQNALLAGGPSTSGLIPTVAVALANLIDSMYAVRAAFRPTARNVAEEFAQLALIL